MVPVGMPSPTLRVVRPSKAEDAERPRRHSHGDRRSEYRKASWSCVRSLLVKPRSSWFGPATRAFWMHLLEGRTHSAGIVGAARRRVIVATGSGWIPASCRGRGRGRQVRCDTGREEPTVQRAGAARAIGGPSGRASCASHSRALKSRPPVRRVLPSGLNATSHARSCRYGRCIRAARLPGANGRSIP
jgi:hypothetical protein